MSWTDELMDLGQEAEEIKQLVFLTLTCLLLPALMFTCRTSTEDVLCPRDDVSINMTIYILTAWFKRITPTVFKKLMNYDAW